MPREMPANGTRPLRLARALAATLALVTMVLAAPGLALANGGADRVGYFYYSGGRRIPLRLDPTGVVLKLGAPGPVDRALDAARAAGVKARAAAPVGPARECFFRLDLSAPGGEAEVLHAVRALAGRPEVAMAAPRFLDEGGSPLALTDRLAVALAPGVDRAWLDSTAARFGAEVVPFLDPSASVFLLRLPAGSAKNALEVANALHEEPEIRFSHPDFIVRRALRAAPSDPLFPRQWHLDNTGQAGALPGADVSALGAWKTTEGSEDVRIAIIDEGVDVDHEEFAGRLVDGIDLVDGDDNPDDVSGGGHGTSCAGVAAAAAGNGQGGTGIAPGVRIIPIRLLGPDGSTTLSTEARAFEWAANHGAAVISNSWGPEDNAGEQPLPDVVREGIDYAAERGRGGKGSVVLFAAGNGNEPVSLDGYASYEKVLAVAASTDQDLHAFYSDLGPEIAFAAPSNGGETTGIWTTDMVGRDGYNPGLVPAGRYFIGVTPFEGPESPYALILGEGGMAIDESEPNDSLAAAQTASYPGTVRGRTGTDDPGDFVDQYGTRYTDLFAADLPGGARIRLDVQGAADLDLAVIAPDGFALLLSERGGSSDEEIRTNVPPGDDLGNYTDSFGGTSSATPLAAGVAALVLSVNPALTRSEVASILEETADQIDTANGDYDESGHSRFYGFGRVNAEKAVQRAAEQNEPPPPAKSGGGGGGCAVGPVASGAAVSSGPREASGIAPWLFLLAIAAFLRLKRAVE